MLDRSVTSVTLVLFERLEVVRSAVKFLHFLAVVQAQLKLSQVEFLFTVRLLACTSRSRAHFAGPPTSSSLILGAFSTLELKRCPQKDRLRCCIIALVAVSLHSLPRCACCLSAFDAEFFSLLLLVRSSLLPQNRSFAIAAWLSLLPFVVVASL